MERDICFAIAGGAKAVSAWRLRAAIAVTPAGSQQRSGGAEKLKDTAVGGQL